MSGSRQPSELADTMPLAIVLAGRGTLRLLRSPATIRLLGRDVPDAPAPGERA